jgi:hypothetical protein
MSPGRYLRAAWTGLPGWARWLLAAYIAGFTDGTGAHIRQLAQGGFHTYAGFPYVALRVFFFSLVLLDLLVVFLCAFARPAGIWLAAVIMVLDVAANTAGNWPRVRSDPVWLVRPAGLLILIVFGVFVLATAPAMLRATSRTPPVRARSATAHRPQ